MEKITNTSFKMTSESEFNKATNHIIRLLKDSLIMIENESYGSSVFFSITALEETTKTHISKYLPYDKNTSRKKDILMDHTEKYKFSIWPTFKIGSRLKNTIGVKKIDRLTELVNNKKEIMNLRDNGIYWATDKDDVNKYPEDLFTKKQAQEILLFSLEAFDDNLVGYTQQSFLDGNMSNEIFDKVAKDYKKESE